MKIKFDFIGYNSMVIPIKRQLERDIKSKEQGLFNLKRTKQEARKRHIRRLKQKYRKLQIKL